MMMMSRLMVRTTKQVVQSQIAVGGLLTSTTMLNTSNGSNGCNYMSTLSRTSYLQYNNNNTQLLQRASPKKGGKDKKGGDDTPYNSIKEVDFTPMKTACEATMDYLRREFGNIRVGRAGPELLERVNVETPSGNMLIQHLAMITVKDSLTLHITPFDPNLLKNIEKALMKSDLGLNPLIQNGLIRISLPKPTQDLRNTLIKNTNTLSENAKVSIRRHRKDGMDLLKKYKLTKDDTHTLDKNVQKTTDDYIAQITKLTESKVKEINS